MAGSKMKKNFNKTLKPKIKLWLDSDNSQGSFGDGKCRLLESIEKTKSLKETCQNLDISYRKAWGDLKKAEQCLNVTLVTKSRGGNKRGQSTLTEDGKAWLDAYIKFRKHVERSSKTAYKKYLQKFEKTQNRRREK